MVTKGISWSSPVGPLLADRRVLRLRGTSELVHSLERLQPMMQ
jgi:hypothetical protein